MSIVRDYTIRAILAGFIAVLFKDAFDLVYVWLGFSGVCMAKVAAAAFISPERVSSFGGLFIGYMAHYTVGGVLGLIFTHYLTATNRSYYISKGVFAGLAAWLFLAGVLLRIGVSSLDPVDISSNVMLFFDHIVFGSTLGYLNKKFVFNPDFERRT